jgi:hypothetical protein
MSEWAYRNCTCGNRVHINFTCDKCDGDPWGVRDNILRAIEIVEKEKHRLELRLARIEEELKELKDDLKRSHMKKSR